MYGKEQFFLKGNSQGRYWPIFAEMHHYKLNSEGQHWPILAETTWDWPKQDLKKLAPVSAQKTTRVEHENAEKVVKK